MPINEKRKVIRTTDYPPNKKLGKKESEKGSEKAEATRVSAVVKPGDISRRKPTLGSKMKSSFLGKQGVEVGRYIFVDVLVPTLVDSVSDWIQNTVYAAFNGGARQDLYSPNRRRSHSMWSRCTPYNNQRPSARDSRRSDPEPRYKDRWDFSQYEFRTRPAAVEVKNRLLTLADEFGHARVGDFFDLRGEEWEYTEGDWVWFIDDLEATSIRRVRGSGRFILDLPNPEPLR